MANKKIIPSKNIFCGYPTNTTFFNMGNIGRALKSKKPLPLKLKKEFYLWNQGLFIINNFPVF